MYTARTMLIHAVVGVLLAAVGASAVLAAEPSQTIAPEIAKLVLNDEKVKEYFHLDVPEGPPILVADHLLPPDISFSDLEFGVEIVHAEEAQGEEAQGEEAKAESMFRFTGFFMFDDKAIVSFQYPPEGLTGSFTFSKQGQQWTVSKRELGEL